MWLLGAAPLRADFIRGDVDRDARLTVSDAVTHILALFGGMDALTCDDAADANDDGELNLADAQSILLFLFASSDSLPYPGALLPGPDPTCDALDCGDAAADTPAVVISEINYNPRGSDRRREFVELYNRSGVDVDVSGYQFTDGIRHTIPPGTVLPAGEFLLALAFPDFSRWPGLDAIKVGPYEGTLADGGERLTLSDGDCVLESVRYDDRAPWPIGADGYGPSLERVDYGAPADDYHSWRVSFRQTGPALGGTPALENTTLGTPTHPTITDVELTPGRPSSSDPVAVRVTLDVDAASVRKVTLRSERATDVLSAVDSHTMELDADAFSMDAGSSTFVTTLPVADSQTIVRNHVIVELSSGDAIALPHIADQAPFFSYFVYDGEIATVLPLLWLFPKLETGLIEERRLLVSGAAIQDVGDAFPQLFDGADVRQRKSTLNPDNGHNLSFLKGTDFRGDRTLNLIPAKGGNIGPIEGHVEQLGFTVYRDLGALAPWSEWFRVVDYTTDEPEARHVQRAVIEQVNRRFLANNGVDDSGDLFKFERQTFQKRTNPHTGETMLNDLIRELESDDPEAVRRAVFHGLDTENICLYSTAVALLGHFESYQSNLFAYNDLSANGRWQIIPWDLDKVFFCTEMVLTYPLEFTGPCAGNGDPTALARAHHLQPDLDRAYRDLVLFHISPGGGFTEEAMEAKIAPIEARLLNDIALLEAFRGGDLPERRQEIRDAYSAIRAFVRDRVQFLKRELSDETP